jgi:hypothetical protein
MVSVANVMFQVRVMQLSFEMELFKFILAATHIVYRDIAIDGAVLPAQEQITPGDSTGYRHLN